jgi:hypothetical protein
MIIVRNKALICKSLNGQFRVQSDVHAVRWRMYGGSGHRLSAMPNGWLRGLFI